jgi:predicted dinucleotide-binding enzyme
MKIGILGTGDVGKTLANGFIKYNHQVMIGSRTPSKLNEWKEKSGGKGSIGTFAEAAGYGDILVLAAKGTAAKDVLKLAGESNLKGKTIIDAANPIANEAPENGVLKFFTNINYSLMEELQAAFPDANFVKAFSCIGSPFMINPDFGSTKPSMFICGNNETAKKQVAEIVELFGFEVEDMGTAEAARAIEPLCILWCIPGFLRNDWGNAFKLLKLKK